MFSGCWATGEQIGETQLPTSTSTSRLTVSSVLDWGFHGMLGKTEVKPNPNPPFLGLTARLTVHLPAPDSPFLSLHLTADDKVLYVSCSLSRGHITLPLT